MATYDGISTAAERPSPHHGLCEVTFDMTHYNTNSFFSRPPVMTLELSPGVSVVNMPDETTLSLTPETLTSYDGKFRFWALDSTVTTPGNWAWMMTARVNNKPLTSYSFYADKGADEEAPTNVGQYMPLYDPAFKANVLRGWPGPPGLPGRDGVGGGVISDGDGGEGPGELPPEVVVGYNPDIIATYTDVMRATWTVDKNVTVFPPVTKTCVVLLMEGFEHVQWSNVTVHGGEGLTGLVYGTLIWDGTEWHMFVDSVSRQQPTVDNTGLEPVSKDAPFMAYSPQHDKIVMWSGQKQRWQNLDGTSLGE